MKTEAIMLQTLSAPCMNRCRHCLLSWDGRITGADFDRSAALAERFSGWLKRERPDIGFQFTYGYSMDHPQLARSLDTLNALGSVMGRFMQMDGLRIRNERESAELLGTLAEHGVRELNFTFYGTQAYHDAFAGRRGDFRFLTGLARLAREKGLHISCGVMFTKESAPLLPELIPQLENAGFSRENRGIVLIVPHIEGRGAGLEPIRASLSDLDAQDGEIRPLLNRTVFKTEAEWLREGIADETRRTLIITLTNENIERCERTPFETLIAEAEALDDAYYGALPGAAELAEMYGEAEGGLLFSRRDMLYRWRSRFIREHGLKLYDVTDETHTGSRRY